METNLVIRECSMFVHTLQCTPPSVVSRDFMWNLLITLKVLGSYRLLIHCKRKYAWILDSIPPTYIWTWTHLKIVFACHSPKFRTFFKPKINYCIQSVESTKRKRRKEKLNSNCFFPQIYANIVNNNTHILQVNGKTTKNLLLAQKRIIY